MPAAQPQATGSSERPLPLASRADLTIEPALLRGQTTWVVKDPVTLNYFHLTPEQHQVLTLLDGRRSLAELRRAVTAAMPACRPSLRELRRLAFDLFDKGLAYSVRPGQGEQLIDRRREQRRRQVMRAVLSLFYIRLPGVDPRPILERVYPALRWLMHPAAVALGCAFIASAWLLLAVKFDEAITRLPPAEAFTTGTLLVLLWATIGAAKLLHELGHALACRHFDGECREIGVAFLVLSPCLYCDVSDAALMPDRRHRLAIGAAGMYVELLLSAVAVFTWWCTEPGWLNNTALSLFLVTNASTLLFNLNPLLRFDGYYLLSDALDTPDLRRRSDRAWNRASARLLAGVRLRDPHATSPREQRWLVAYASASHLYRWSFLMIMTLALHALLKPYGLGAVGVGLGVVAAATALGQAAVRVSRFVAEHRDHLETSPRPRLVALGGLLIVAAAILVPLPLSQEAIVSVQPLDGRPVYVSTPGRLVKQLVVPGQRVVRGQPLAVLVNLQKRDRYLRLHTATLVSAVDIAVHRATGDAAAEEKALAGHRALYEDARSQRLQLEQLVIKAPCAGVVVEPRPRHEEPAAPDPTRLRRWGASPLVPENRNAYLERGTHLLTIAPGDRRQAVLSFDQHSRQAFESGVTARLRFDSYPGITLKGVVDRASSWADLPAGAHEAGRCRARVVLPANAPPLLADMSGRARVWVSNRSAAGWLWRHVRRTFNHHF